MSWLFPLEVTRLALLVGILGYAALKDYRHGEVSNKVWLYIPFGAALTVIQLSVFTPYLLVFAIPLMLVMGGLSVVLFYLSDHVKRLVGDGLLGGADSKALLAISLCYPLTPSFSFVPYVNYVVLAFAVAGLFMLIRKGLRRGLAVRFLPYLFFGFIMFAL